MAQSGYTFTIEEKMPEQHMAALDALSFSSQNRDFVIFKDGEECFRAHLRADADGVQFKFDEMFLELRKDLDRLRAYDDLADEVNRLSGHYLSTALLKSRLTTIKEGRR